MPRQTVSSQSLAGSDTATQPAARTNPSQWPFDQLPTHMALSYRSTGASSVMAGAGVSQPAGVGDLFGMMPSIQSQPPPPAHIAPPTCTETSSALAAESSVIVQPLTSTSAPSYAASLEPTYLGVASSPVPSAASNLLSVKNNPVPESTEPMSVESIPLPAADRSLPSSASSAYSEHPPQHQYLPSHQHSVIVHPSTSSSHPASYPSEPLELLVSSRGGKSSVGEQSFRPRNPPSYDDVQAASNVCLDLTNPYRSSSGESSTTRPGARSSSSETAP